MNGDKDNFKRGEIELNIWKLWTSHFGRSRSLVMMSLAILVAILDVSNWINHKNMAAISLVAI